MAVFVADASMTLAWCFKDEATSRTENLFKQVHSDGEAIVPAHWSAEVLNGLQTAVRRKRIGPEQPAVLWEKLNLLYISAEPPLTSPQAKAVLALSNQYALTAYDAIYLELALRKALPLATLDAALHRAAVREHVSEPL